MAAVQTTKTSVLETSLTAQIDMIWQMAKISLEEHNNEMIIPAGVYQVIGSAGLEELKFRLSDALGNAPIVAVHDSDRDQIRVMKLPSCQQQRSSYTSTEALKVPKQSSALNTINSKASQPVLRAFGKKAKVPRPLNAFVLYRQHWHPYYRQHYKDWHNNDISKELGRRWRTESEEVKKKYKQLAEELKKEHATLYPDYQYAPRKPGEKKRRMTARKLEKLREAQSVRQSSSFPSPESSSISDFDSPSEGLYNGNSFSQDDILNQDVSGYKHISTELPTLPPQPVEYREDGDTFTSTFPSSFSNIQDEIQRENGTYQQEYCGTIQDVEADEILHEHLLQATPSDTAINNQNSWESFIDWQMLNTATVNTQNMAVDPDDLTAKDASVPENGHKLFGQSAGPSFVGN